MSGAVPHRAGQPGRHRARQGVRLPRPRRPRRARRHAGAGAAARPAGRPAGWSPSIRPTPAPAAARACARRVVAGPGAGARRARPLGRRALGGGALRPFLVTASPPTNVAGLPAVAADRRSAGARPHAGAADLLAGGRRDAAAAARRRRRAGRCWRRSRLGPTLVVVPSVDRRPPGGEPVAPGRARRRAGAAGVGARRGRRRRRDRRPGRGVGAVPGPRRDRRASTSTTSRCRRSAARRGTPATSPSSGPGGPGCRCCWCRRARRVNGLAAVGDRLGRPAIDDERAGWPLVEVVDRSPRRAVEDVARHVAADHPPARPRQASCASTTRRGGRGSWPAAACRTLARCAVCDAAVGLADDGTLACRRCGTVRPAVCLQCGASAFANLRPGVTRLREELEAAAGRPVVAVTGRRRRAAAAGRDLRRHRGRAAPRARGPTSSPSSTSTPSCWRRATAPPSRRWRCSCAAPGWTGGRGDGGRLLVQTFLPRHEVVRAALLADPGRLVEPERARRRAARPAAVRRPRRDLRRRAATTSPPPCGAIDGITVGGAAGALHRPRRRRGSARPGDHVRPPPEGRPPPRRGRPAPPVAPSPSECFAASECFVRGPPARDTRMRSNTRMGSAVDLQEAVALGAAQAAGREALGGEPAVEASRRRGASGRRGRRGRRASGGRATSAAGRGGRPCRCGSAGSTRSRRSGRRPGRRRGATTVTRHPVGRGVRRAQRPGPLVDVDGPHVERRCAQRQRQRDRPGAAAEVEPDAGRRRRRRGTAAAPRVPASRRPWLNTPRSVRIVNDDVAGRATRDRRLGRRRAR